jgi:L,D-peptidoglycan transpeptidase YkuD (ErfK/YbiS/YcfS/YnhG family)
MTAGATSPAHPTSRHKRAVVFAVAICLALFALGALANPGTPLSSASAQESSGSVDSSATTASPIPTPTPLPLQMKRIGNTKQLIIVTGKKLGAKNGTLQFFDYENGAWVCTLTATARLGKHGLMDGTRRRAGNKTTPTGLWEMPGFVFGTHAHAPAHTKMGYRHITKKSWWSSKWDKTYNQWVEAKTWPGEHLYNVLPQYEFAVSMGYNASPNTQVFGRGSGIFLHINGHGNTAGCVAISRAKMIRVVGLLDPAKHPAFAVGTLVPGAKTSILAY